MDDMRKSTRLKLKKLGAKYQAMVGWWGGAIVAAAPAGYYWAADPGVHELVDDPSWEDSEEEAAKDLIERMSYGIDKCDTPDCGWCKDPGYPEMVDVIYDPRTTVKKVAD
jgi:hypothetical protein